MKRYSGQGDMFDDPEDGDYVLYSQANALLQLRNEKLEAMQRQLVEVTRERDHYKAACALADALRNHERGL